MSADRFDGSTLIDWERSACLCDVGSPGFVAAWSVAPDGEDVAWLVDEAELLKGADAQHGSANQVHEQLGPLPGHWRARVYLSPIRCGRARADGRPCRQLVGAPGRPCAWHSERTNAP